MNRTQWLNHLRQVDRERDAKKAKEKIDSLIDEELREESIATMERAGVMTDITMEELKTSHKYWVTNFNEKQKSIDKLCTQTAERLGRIDYQLWRKDGIDYMLRYELTGKRDVLYDILRHFHGFIDLDYLIANDGGQEDIERNKTRAERTPKV